VSVEVEIPTAEMIRRLREYGNWSGPSTPPAPQTAMAIADRLERFGQIEAAASRLMTLVEPMVRGNTDFSVTWRKYVREMRAALNEEPRS
jgi:hypothetical protein